MADLERIVGAAVAIEVETGEPVAQRLAEAGARFDGVFVPQKPKVSARRFIQEPIQASAAGDPGAEAAGFQLTSYRMWEGRFDPTARGTWPLPGTRQRLILFLAVDASDIGVVLIGQHRSSPHRHRPSAAGNTSAPFSLKVRLADRM
jgi:hypothetical protein